MAVIGAAVALSIGYLGNNISLDAQEFGVGETNLESPVDDLGVTVVIGRTFGIVDSDFKDLIEECIFHSLDLVEKDSIITCKLLDISGNVIAEGKKIVDPDLLPLTPFTMPIDDFEFVLAHNIDNVHDIIIVIQGP